MMDPPEVVMKLVCTIFRAAVGYDLKNQWQSHPVLFSFFFAHRTFKPYHLWIIGQAKLAYTAQVSGLSKGMSSIITVITHQIVQHIVHS